MSLAITSEIDTVIINARIYLFLYSTPSNEKGLSY